MFSEALRVGDGRGRGRMMGGHGSDSSKGRVGRKGRGCRSCVLDDERSGHTRT